MLIRHAPIILSLIILLLTSSALSAAEPLHFLFLSGSQEYQSKPSLEAWKAELEAKHPVTITLCHAKDKSKGPIEGFEAIENADLLVAFCRRWILPKEQNAMLEAYVASKKPIIGIRTASHGFNSYKPFDSILGGSYKGHGGQEQVVVSVVSDHQDHPILAGVPAQWDRVGKLYHNKKNAEDTITLLKGVGQKSSTEEPLAWAREHEGRRTFYTGMGYPHDFENEHFKTLMHNALSWCLQQELSAKE